MSKIRFHSQQLIRAFLVIYACLFAGNALADLLPMVIPGSVVGMLILFILLTLQIVPVHWVKPGCNLLISHMALLFVPIGVGVMQYFDVISQQFSPIIVSCVISTAITLLVVGYSSHRVHRERTIMGKRLPKIEGEK